MYRSGRWLQRRGALAAIFGSLATLATGTGAGAANCGVTSVGKLPLDELGSGLYLSQYQGGFYPGGVNYPPLSHLLAGRAAAAAIQPLDLAGNPDPAGKYVLLSIGMSNTTQEYCSGNSALPCDAWTFMGQAAVDPGVNHSTLVLVNGARSGQTAPTWDSPADSNYDLVRDTRLTPQGLGEQQVVAAWIKLANGVPTTSLPAANADAYVIEAQMGNVVRALKTRYPNIRMAFFTTRLYAGYASNTLNPEPYAYEYGFSVKWLVQAQITQRDGGGLDARAGDLGPSVAPWIGWGPYLWADGLTPRSDGLTWACADFENDGTHPSTSGEQKVGTRLLEFLRTSFFAIPWFRAGYLLFDDFETGDTGAWADATR